MRQYLEVSPTTILRAEPQYFNSYTAFDCRTCASFSLSRQQYALLSTAAATPFEFVPFEQLYRQLPVHPEHVSGLSELLANGIVRVGTGTTPLRAYEPLPSAAVSSDERPTLSSPTSIEMCLTRRCNQTCYHCNVSAYSEAPPERLPISFWLGILKQCLEAKVLKVTLTGGEPFVRQGWDELYEAFCQSRIAVSILTNGTRIREDQMVLMARAGHTLSISLDGVTAEQHDSFRRDPGSFQRTVRTMRRLHEHGVIFTLNTVVHAENVKDVDHILEIGQEVGASTIVFVPMTAVGRGASAPAQKYFPENATLWAAMNRIRSQSFETAGPRVVVADFEKREQIEIGNRYSGATITSRRVPGLCKAGVYAMAIDEDGRAYSCLRGLQSRIFPIGDLTTHTLQEVWASLNWEPFRDSSQPMVPCRVEHLGKNPPVIAVASLRRQSAAATPTPAALVTSDS